MKYGLYTHLSISYNSLYIITPSSVISNVYKAYFECNHKNSINVSFMSRSWQAFLVYGLY
jgi:hypothetical protein